MIARDGNNADTSWKIDTREQLLALSDHGQSRPAFASSDAGLGQSSRFRPVASAPSSSSIRSPSICRMPVIFPRSTRSGGSTRPRAWWPTARRSRDWRSSRAMSWDNDDDAAYDYDLGQRPVVIRRRLRRSCRGRCRCECSPRRSRLRCSRRHCRCLADAVRTEPGASGSSAARPGPGTDPCRRTLARGGAARPGRIRAAGRRRCAPRGARRLTGHVAPGSARLARADQRSGLAHRPGLGIGRAATGGDGPPDRHQLRHQRPQATRLHGGTPSPARGCIAVPDGSRTRAISDG